MHDRPITRDNLNDYLKELAKEFRRLNGVKMPAEIILIGGAAVLANYGFREMTYDIDAIILASGAMKEAINRTGDKLGLPNGWLNADFKRTGSYSDKLYEISVYYRTFSNILQVRTVAAEYLIAMKLMSGRRYKNDISDIYGVLWEHKRDGIPISRTAVDEAAICLYGNVAALPEASRALMDKAYENGDYETLYRKSREDEKEAKELLLEFERDYPNALKAENIDSVIDRAKQKRIAPTEKKTLSARLGEAKEKVGKNSIQPASHRNGKNGQNR